MSVNRSFGAKGCSRSVYALLLHTDGLTSQDLAYDAVLQP
jgi:hypothetical protein